IPGHKPSTVSTSLWQTPQACTLIRTCPAPGLGISRSTIWKPAPPLGICATFIVATEILVVAINPSCLICQPLLINTDETTEHRSPHLDPATSSPNAVAG